MPPVQVPAAPAAALGQKEVLSAQAPSLPATQRSAAQHVASSSSTPALSLSKQAAAPPQQARLQAWADPSGQRLGGLPGTAPAASCGQSVALWAGPSMSAVAAELWDTAEDCCMQQDPYGPLLDALLSWGAE